MSAGGLEIPRQGAPLSHWNGKKGGRMAKGCPEKDG